MSGLDGRGACEATVAHPSNLLAEFTGSRAGQVRDLLPDLNPMWEVLEGEVTNEIPKSKRFGVGIQDWITGRRSRSAGVEVEAPVDRTHLGQRTPTAEDPARTEVLHATARSLIQP